MGMDSSSYSHQYKTGKHWPFWESGCTRKLKCCKMSFNITHLLALQLCNALLLKAESSYGVKEHRYLRFLSRIQKDKIFPINFLYLLEQIKQELAIYLYMTAFSTIRNQEIYNCKFFPVPLLFLQRNEVGLQLFMKDFSHPTELKLHKDF